MGSTAQHSTAQHSMATMMTMTSQHHYTRLCGAEDTPAPPPYTGASTAQISLNIDKDDLIDRIQHQIALYRECVNAGSREASSELEVSLRAAQVEVQRRIAAERDETALKGLLTANDQLSTLLGAPPTPPSTTAAPVVRPSSLPEPILTCGIAQCTNLVTGSCMHCGAWVKTEVTKSGGMMNWGFPHVLHRCPSCRKVIANTRGTGHTQGPGDTGDIWHFG